MKMLLPSILLQCEEEDKKKKNIKRKYILPNCSFIKIFVFQRDMVNKMMSNMNAAYVEKMEARKDVSKSRKLILVE
jgi:hypothetical protein